ncbi:hypothetical protein [Nitrosomonas sp. Is37]|uniref:hypothetical protein n=1 Tax=Nitrosomonas sp. Is37 TaxID=3080535 RepID=UPI00294ABD26|nr:hypothetical protein [Nitrosomonas sp. Is37]MDV6344203.1 hypothetical protein [Nitrosomonas sp. Is37]
MKHRIKQFILSACSLALLSSFNFASADTASDAEILLNWAENTYPEFFPSHQATQSIEPWLFRYYPEVGIYAGVNKTDNGIYVLGGPWGNNPTFIDSLPNMITHIVNLGGNGSIPACNTANVPAGLVFTQSGNVVNVTTNGQCIPLPTNPNLCEAPRQASATGISLLTTSNVTSSEIRGITIDLPGIPNPFQSFANDSLNGKHCTINAPRESPNLTVHSDVCYDMTSAFEGQFQSVPGITVNPPITMAAKNTITSQTVADCFATDANSIYDAFTNEVWIKKNGDFVKISN